MSNSWGNPYNVDKDGWNDPYDQDADVDYDITHNARDPGGLPDGAGRVYDGRKASELPKGTIWGLDNGRKAGEPPQRTVRGASNLSTKSNLSMKSGLVRFGLAVAGAYIVYRYVLKPYVFGRK